MTKIGIAIICCLILMARSTAHAEPSGNPQNSSPESNSSQNNSSQPATSNTSAPGSESNAPPPENKSPPPQEEEEDYSENAFTEYAEFNQSEEEEEDAKFFQYGRLFGVSLGLGFEFADGYRGLLWQGGFPAFDFKLHYWFDFHIAFDLNIFVAQQYFNTTAQSLGYVNVNLMRIGIDIKYYFDTKNLSAPISFANPYLLLGGGSYSKTQNSNLQGTQDSDTSLGLTAGVGLEFALKHRKVYLAIEGKIHLVTFQDTYTTQFQTVGLPNLTGNIYTLACHVLFTW